MSNTLIVISVVLLVSCGYEGEEVTQDPVASQNSLCLTSAALAEAAEAPTLPVGAEHQTPLDEDLSTGETQNEQQTHYEDEPELPLPPAPAKRANCP